MRDVIITAGHTNVKGLDRGASANGFVEGELAVNLRDNLIKELMAYGIKVKTDKNQNALAQTLSWLKTVLISNKSICIDIHWNAGGGTGVEVIIPDASTPFERSLAQAIADRISSVTGLKKRSGGVKPESMTPRKKLGWMRPNAENILIETCFIDSVSDMATYNANKEGIVKGLAKIIADFSKL